MLGGNLKKLKTGKGKREEKEQHALILGKAMHIFMPYHVRPTSKELPLI